MEYVTVKTGFGTSHVTVPDPSVKCTRSPLRRGSQAETVAPSTHAKGRFHSNHCY
jgi:hypothetical protein